MINFKIIPPLLAGVVVVLFVVFIVHFSTGIPQADDFPMMFRFLDQWDKSTSLGAKYFLLTEQFLDHRMVAMKLTVLAVKAIQGKMSINAVNGVGVAIWLGTIYILYKAVAGAGLPLVSFLPVLFFTLHPGYGFDGLLWAATWMAFPWAIFLSLTSFYLLVFHESRATFILAWILAFFALFSHGNGIFTFFVCLFIILSQRKWKPAGVWSLVSCAALALFFFHYTSGVSATAPPLENIMERPLYIISSVGAFTGASLFFPDFEITAIAPEHVPVIVFGLLLCMLVLVYSLKVFLSALDRRSRSFDWSSRNRLLLFCCAIGVFIVLTAVTISCVRTSANVLRGFAARYHFYSALMISIVYIMGLVLFPKWVRGFKFRLAAVVLSAVYCLGQYWYQTASLADHVRIYEAGLYNSEKSGMWVLYKDARFWERGVDQYTNENLRPDGSEHYKLPDAELDPESIPETGSMRTLPHETLIKISDSEDSLSVQVGGPLFHIPMFGSVVNGTYVHLVSEDKSFLYPLCQERSGLRQFVKDRFYYKSQAAIGLKKKWFSPGLYRLYLYIVRNKTRIKINTHRLIRIKAYPYEV